MSWPAMRRIGRKNIVVLEELGNKIFIMVRPLQGSP
jgi:hypothetical protein